MTAFFIPGMCDGARSVEDAYRTMRCQIELEMGRRPSARRIATLWTRRGRLDCVTEVGARDPLRDGTVLAIFDMGPHQPFIVWWQPDGDIRDAVWEVLGSSAYSVLEFDA